MLMTGPDSTQTSASDNCDFNAKHRIRPLLQTPSRFDAAQRYINAKLHEMSNSRRVCDG
jgi:hypothetical protein